MVAVREHGATKCGGALITPQVVITAAHCVNQTKAHELSVAVGVVDTSPGQEGPRQGQVVAVEDVVAHPYFYHTSRTHFNVALLLLNDPVRLDRGVGTICMPGQEQSFAGSSGCVVSAWGDPAGKNSNKLKTLEVPVVPYARCKELIRKTEAWKPPGSRYFLDISLLCAGGNSGSGVCKGDEGSPLVCPMPGQPGRHQLAGVVAFAWPSAQLGRCGFGEDVPDMYANVGLVRSWVDDVLKSHRMDSSAYWP
ncbi:hypothetical protein ONE63_005119 [Megalurothrips usitatus]|uniref:Peptidase S1 domain-containing protein n=1 Tax=Megalurothrips usitatus TaxID=439358 RepID=A0AAV7XWZ1_9NEOP|nr:hypothetical protein ONE63_005119 [Megalurothrips usitatus]